MPVDVKPGEVAVFPLAHHVGHIPDGEDIGAAKQRETVVEIESRTCFHFRQNRLQTRVFDGDGHVYKRRPTYMSAAQNSKNNTLT